MYGKNLNIVNEFNEIITDYPTVKYKRPNIFKISQNINYDTLIDGLIDKERRGRGDLQGPCILCGSEKKLRFIMSEV